ncbi:coiled-coil domain-containing protein 40-like [Dendronephthya gigantea]|uniref:coiled-coil domain-containing protein 40-like n=1 Tax=Dendronephthya gigantea TaxID=151771 RepID=UPI00106C7A5D|nr:coiled-coil domain-containing protein 40-like [Dendronephthya gigantea]
MADKSEDQGDLPQDFGEKSSGSKLNRPVSGKSGGSTGSKKSMSDAVNQLTAKALREFRLDDEGTTVSESAAGDTVTPNSNLVKDSEEPIEGPEGETLLEDDEDYEMQDENELQDENDVEFDENIDIINDDFSGEDDSDGDNDLVVLDPDHPLMVRFQTAYKNHLLKQKEKLELEEREVVEELTRRKKDREELGVNLYNSQQELARLQMLLEKEHDKYNENHNLRTKAEGKLNSIKEIHSKNTNLLVEQRKKAEELRSEVENLASRVLYMREAKEDVRSDIAVMRRAAEKAHGEVSQAEQLKKKQDFLVDRLTQKVDRLHEEITMYEAQTLAQEEETRSAQRTLAEAVTEIEAIELEKKQLYQQWQSSLIGMSRRDEAFAAMQQALNLQKERIKTIETELDGYRNSISKAQATNEQLTLMQNRIEADISMVKKLTSVSLNKQEILKTEYSKYSRMLHETEQALNKAKTDITLRESELTALRKQIEREYEEKVRTEESIMEKLRSQMTLDKAAQYSKKVTDKIKKRGTELDNQLAQVENDISRDLMAISNVQTRLRNLGEILEQLNEEIRKKNETAATIENDIVKKNAVIERKQNMVDQFNKKIDVLKNKDGGQQLGPLELQISTLQKQVESSNNEIIELQQFWLRNQSELVKTVQRVGQQSEEIKSLKKQNTILLHKKQRTEGDIQHHLSEMKDIERNIRNMQNEMTKLNTLITNERGLKNNLEQSNILMEDEFIRTLKEAERESVELQSNIDGMKEEKERLLNSLVEAERQIMLWEKKTQLAREARATVDDDYGHGEIKAMKAEIHRMQVRHSQLMKQQEKMIQNMERSVTKREFIITRGDAQTKTGKSTNTKGAYQRKVAELKKKIKQTNNDANECDKDIRSLQENQKEVSTQLEDKQSKVYQLQSTVDEADMNIDRLTDERQRNLADIIAAQKKVKHLTAVKEGRYSTLCKTSETLDNELQKQKDRLQSLMTIVDRLNQEFPYAQPALRKITLSLGSRSQSEP